MWMLERRPAHIPCAGKCLSYFTKLMLEHQFKVFSVYNERNWIHGSYKPLKCCLWTSSETTPVLLNSSGLCWMNLRVPVSCSKLGLPFHPQPYTGVSCISCAFPNILGSNLRPIAHFLIIGFKADGTHIPSLNFLICPIWITATYFPSVTLRSNFLVKHRKHFYKKSHKNFIHNCSKVKTDQCLLTSE